jgi:hypothetical protein
MYSLESCSRSSCAGGIAWSWLACVKGIHGFSYATYSIEEFRRQFHLDVGFMDSVWPSARYRDEAVRCEYVPEHTDTLIRLEDSDICPGRLLVQRVLNYESASGSNSVVSQTWHIDEGVVQGLP